MYPSNIGVHTSVSEFVDNRSRQPEARRTMKTTTVRALIAAGLMAAGALAIPAAASAEPIATVNYSITINDQNQSGTIEVPPPGL